MPRDPSTAVTYATEAAYDSDGQEDSSSKASSSGGSGVLLGFDDGPLTQNKTDRSYIDEYTLDVSRIGGKPAFPLPESHLPPPSVTSCPTCSNRMLLLIQIHAPLTDEQVEGSKHAAPYAHREEFDRMLYVFACVRKDCTGVRCIRAARRNPAYAKQGKLRRQRNAESVKKKAEALSAQRSHNPFASTTSSIVGVGGTSLANPFASSSSSQKLFGGPVGGIGSSIFGKAIADPSPLAGSTVEKSQTLAIAEDNTEEQAEQFATSWPAPDNSASRLHIPPHYLSTSPETLAASSSNARNRQADLAKQLDSLQLSGGASKGFTKSTADDGSSECWSAEAYEVMRVVGVEEVFLAFQERLEMSDAPEQVVRYEFGGTPLPFSANSAPFKQLYIPSLPTPSTSSSKRVDVNDATGMRTYDSPCASIPACPHCGAARTFELQLMPNLVNIVDAALRDTGAKDIVSGAEAQASDAELGWATVWCFVCSADCLANDIDTNDKDSMHWQGWREEVALVELED